MVETIIEDIEFSRVLGRDEGWDVMPVVVTVILKVVGIVADFDMIVGAVVLKEDV